MPLAKPMLFDLGTQSLNKTNIFIKMKDDIVEIFDEISPKKKKTETHKLF
jgi:hypothetical protein